MTTLVSSVKPQFGASLTDYVRVGIYDCNMFIIQATGYQTSLLDAELD